MTTLAQDSLRLPLYQQKQISSLYKNVSRYRVANSNTDVYCFTLSDRYCLCVELRLDLFSGATAQREPGPPHS